MQRINLEISTSDLWDFIPEGTENMQKKKTIKNNIRLFSKARE